MRGTMSNISELLDSLYRDDQAVDSLEKTAEAHLRTAILGEDAPAHSPYADMTDDELITLLQEEGHAKTASHQSASERAELEKTAAEMLGGQIMAHALVHEVGLIKEAMVQGLCRVCKSSPMDVEGSSICSSCLQGD